MASCVRNIRTKHYQNLIIGFQVTVENVGDVFLRQCIYVLLTVTIHNLKHFWMCESNVDKYALNLL